jgi:hypothetical protein
MARRRSRQKEIRRLVGSIYRKVKYGWSVKCPYFIVIIRMIASSLYYRRFGLGNARRWDIGTARRRPTDKSKLGSGNNSDFLRTNVMADYLDKMSTDINYITYTEDLVEDDGLQYFQMCIIIGIIIYMFLCGGPPATSDNDVIGTDKDRKRTSS